MVEIVGALLKLPQNGVQTQHLSGSYQHDQIMGWTHKPGTYQYADTSDEPARTFQVTYQENGARFSGQSPSPAQRFIGLLGCSFIEGFGLDDTDTLGAQLQKRLPSYSVENFGVAGYGTYQSLLTFRRLANRYAQKHNSVVIYGFAGFHNDRNIKSTLFQRTSEPNAVFPVCDENHCFYWQGKRMNGMWRMSRILSLVENALDTIRARVKAKYAEAVTKRLLRILKNETDAQGIRLVIAPMTAVDGSFGAFFSENAFEVAPCFLPEFNSNTYRLSDGHPNAHWNKLYSECLRDFISNKTNK